MGFLINPYALGTGGGGGSGAAVVLDLESDVGISVSDGQAIGTWEDQSPSGNDATQAASGRLPTYRATGGPGGRPCVESVADLGHDFMALTPFTVQSCTILCVLKALDSGQHAILSGGNLAPLYWIDGLKQKWGKHGFGVIGTSTTDVSTTAFQRMGLTWDGTTVTFYLNGSADGTGTNATTFGAGINGIWRNNLDSNWEWAGSGCMIKIWDDVLTSGELATEFAAMNTRWGV